jgi:hypothetical protein
MNFDPAALFTITRALAVQAGLDVAPLDAIVQLGGIQYLTTTPPSSRRRANEFTYVVCSIFFLSEYSVLIFSSCGFRGFNLPNFVDTAFKKLQSDVQLTAGVLIGT